MLGILLIYFIGNYFYKLAVEYNKNKWLFAVLGVIAYYLGTIIFGVAFYIYTDLYAETNSFEQNEMLINIIAIPFGLALAAVFYSILKKSWTKNQQFVDDEVIDGMGIEKH